MGFCGRWHLQSGRSRGFAAAFDFSDMQRANQYKNRFFSFYLQTLLDTRTPSPFCLFHSDVSVVLLCFLGEPQIKNQLRYRL